MNSQCTRHKPIRRWRWWGMVSVVMMMAAVGVEGAKKSSRSSSAARRGGPPPSRTSKSSRSGPPPRSSRSRYEDEEEDEFEEFGMEEELEDDDEEEEDYGRRPARGGGGSRASKSSSSRRRPREDDYYEDDEEEEEEDDYRRPPPKSRRPPQQQQQQRPRKGGPPPRQSRGGPPPRRGSVVPYGHRGRGPPQPNGAAQAFTRGLSALRESIPDVSTVRDAAVNAAAAARETTTRLSSNVYREIKGMTSSELEQVMLKATRPDDAPVKGKHVERLVGVTYQVPTQFDIYDAILRKLWSKMAETDWRTKMKAVYMLHRFSSDGAPAHAAALKARLREFRRTRDPKRKGVTFFNSKTLLAGDHSPASEKFRAYLERYAHYVLLRAQCFGGAFDEILPPPAQDASSSSKRSSKKSSSSAAAAKKPLTSTSLRLEHLEAAAMILKAASACHLRKDETCEHTAAAAERVVTDLMALSSAVATCLNRAIPLSETNNADLLRQWCEFFAEQLLPQTKAMMKKLTPSLDEYGLHLPSRIGTSIAPELLERGLQLKSDPKEEGDERETDAGEAKKEENGTTTTATATTRQAPSTASTKGAAAEDDEEASVEDEEEDEDDEEEEEDDDDDYGEEDEDEYEEEEEEYEDDEDGEYYEDEDEEYEDEEDD